MNVSMVKSLNEMITESPLAGSNADYLESMYECWLNNSDSVGPYWQEYFSKFKAEAGESTLGQIRLAFIQQQNSLVKSAVVNQASGKVNSSLALEKAEKIHKQVKVLQLINAYRFTGHLAASNNPLLTTEQRETNKEGRKRLQITEHELAASDMHTSFDTGSLVIQGPATLAEIIDLLEASYCGSLGVEYMHITITAEKRWLQGYIEGQHGIPRFSVDQKKALLRQLSAAEGLERYLHTRYVGQKRFSLEGGDCLIPMLNEIIQRGGVKGVSEVAIGMAHRGRLNVLVNTMGKTPTELTQEFEGAQTINDCGTGDVKYHKGFSADFKTDGNNVHVILAFNPSHLEIVAPVVEGSVRARQDRRQDNHGTQVVPVVVHGDAAFAGQGVVMETFNMSQSRGYSTKGTIHIVVNNQIGFTTSNQRDARSTLYCTDVAKMVNAPIFHVNGEDPEAVIFATQMAFDYRMKFHKDVVIDMICYRRHGHSEADEPMATQPEMYTVIRNKDTVRDLYAKKLVALKLMDENEPRAYLEEYRQRLEDGQTVCDLLLDSREAVYEFTEDWSPYEERVCSINLDTGVELSRLRSLYDKIYTLPDGFELHPGVRKIIDSRALMVRGDMPLDWGCAELLAYASLLTEGFAVRLSGQDCGRGTFFHRHALVRDQKTGLAHIPLQYLSKDQKKFLVINSLLSEEAVLAFEYGYSTTSPDTLTIWEAQFGDFANGAQVVIDQFISAGEQKWNRLCGLVMFLPHGYEGQGPEHSSARLERYLQLCAQENMQVCVPSSASQIFHLLRRQMLSTCRKPLIVMTPKSLLRNKLASSPLDKFEKGSFRKLIPSTIHSDDAQVTRVVMCSGKVYYDLVSHAETLQLSQVAIIRIEQLYPFPQSELVTELARYTGIIDYVWCQEEPKNQGAWYSTQHKIKETIGLGNQLHYAGRPLMAAPAVGQMSLHKQQLEQFVAEALTSC